MRVQLQESLNNGVTTETHAIVRQAPSRTGVSVAQVRNAMNEMYLDVSSGRVPWFPYNNLEHEFFTGVIVLSQKLGNYPPNGVLSGGNIERYEIPYRRKSYRIDIENLRGHNLRF